MMIFRPARHSDLSAVYNLQNVPFRQQVFVQPLPAYETFIEGIKERLKNHESYLYILENDSLPIGFTEFLKLQENWDFIFWGRWLKTLAYASGKVGFHDLGFAKLTGVVREENVQMIRMYKHLGIRLVRRDHILYYRPGLFSIASTYLNFYEISAEEFRDKSALLKRNSLPLIFR